MSDVPDLFAIRLSLEVKSTKANEDGSYTVTYKFIAIEDESVEASVNIPKPVVDSHLLDLKSELSSLVTTAVLNDLTTFYTSN